MAGCLGARRLCVLMYGLNIPEQPLGSAGRRGRKHAALSAVIHPVLNTSVCLHGLLRPACSAKNVYGYAALKSLPLMDENQEPQAGTVTPHGDMELARALLQQCDMLEQGARGCIANMLVQLGSVWVYYGACTSLRMWEVLERCKPRLASCRDCGVHD